MSTPESTERVWPSRIERGWESRASESEVSIPVELGAYGWTLLAADANLG